MHSNARDPAETLGLLEHVRAGDRKSLDRLFATHAAYLRKVVAMRLGAGLRRRTSVSDVIQATQVDALEQIDAYLESMPCPFRLWLRKLAHERVRRVWRENMAAAKRDVRREVPIPDRSSVRLVGLLRARGPSPSQEAARRETAARVRRALAELPESDCEVLLMRNFEDMPYAEIGYVLGITPAAARKRHGRALIHLSKVLLDDGFTESAL